MWKHAVMMVQLTVLSSVIVHCFIEAQRAGSVF